MKTSQARKTLFPLCLGVLLSFGCSHAPVQNEAKSHDLKVKIADFDTQKIPNKIQFGSCADQKKPEPIWQVMKNENPDLYLGMGDNIYASQATDRPLRRIYDLQAQVPEFNAYRAQIPMLATWDDHDYGLNDGGFENPEKAENKIEFMRFFPWDAQAINDKQGGVYHSFMLGNEKQNVHIIFLDTRWFRSRLEAPAHPKNSADLYAPTADTTKTFLGEEQWKWLDLELKKSARLTVIVSSVQLINNAHSFERWGTFPHERERFLKLISQKGPRSVIVISGDRHQGEIHQLELPGFGKLYDITASGINRISRSTSEEPADTRVYGIYKTENYGVIDLDWANKKASVLLKDINGKTIQSIDLAL